MSCQACCSGVVAFTVHQGALVSYLFTLNMWVFARPADGEHCPASSLKASGVQPANPLPAVGSGL